MNRVLTRQLRKVELSYEAIPHTMEGWQKFLAHVNRFYHESDRRIYYLENTLTVSMQEMDIALRRTKLVQAEMIQSSKLASLGTLAAGVAHEINNSINYVNSAIVALERILKADTELSENNMVCNLVEMMREGVNLVLDIVLSLNDYSGLNQAQWKNVNIYRSVQSVLRIIRNRLDQRTVVNEVPQDMDIFINLISLGQILMNLFLNAIDATGEEGRVIISVDDNGEDIVLSVKDNGSGMNEEVKGRIFEPFFTTKEHKKCPGLGMYIVKREADFRGGKIEIFSQPDQGTEIKIWFPKAFQTSDPLVRIRTAA